MYREDGLKEAGTRNDCLLRGWKFSEDKELPKHKANTRYAHVDLLKCTTCIRAGSEEADTWVSRRKQNLADKRDNDYVAAHLAAGL